MKKIIYGLIVLLGGILISCNFNVDSSKLDHKKVSASGVACKWISESGYGIGPIYINEDDNNIEETYEDDGAKVVMSVSKSSNEFLFIIPCSTANGSDVPIDGTVLYEKSGNNYNKYTGFIGTKLSYAVPSTVKTASKLIYFENGKAKKARQYDGTGTLYVTNNVFSTSWYDVDDINYQAFFLARLGDSGPTSLNSSWQKIGYETDVNNDGEFTFTCVCAEY